MSEASDERPPRRRRRRRGKRGPRRRRAAPPPGVPEVAAVAPAAPAAVAPAAPAVVAPAAVAPAAVAPAAVAPVAAVEPAVVTGAEPSAPSAPARRDHAARETSAGGIVYRVKDGEPLFLLIRDSYRNWGFPKGHLEAGEQPQEAAVREVQEETGLGALRVDGAIETIDWFFRFRGKLVHKVCHFFLMRTHHQRTSPQRAEGITACRWARFEEATELISYANARAVLVRAHEMVQASRPARREGAPRERPRGARRG